MSSLYEAETGLAALPMNLQALARLTCLSPSCSRESLRLKLYGRLVTLISCIKLTVWKINLIEDPPTTPRTDR